MHNIDFEQIVKDSNNHPGSIFCYIDWVNFCNSKDIENSSQIFFILLDLKIFVPTADDCANYALDYYTFIIKNNKRIPYEY